MSYNILAGGSEYVMNQYNEQEQTRECGMLLTPLGRDARSPRCPSSINSQYVDMDLRSFIVVNPNRNYQEFPSTVQRTPLVGNPISADEIRKRADGLENAVYSPIIINGTLYFVSLDNDTRTARSSTSINSVKTAASSSSVCMDDATFTLKELKDLLPQYALRRLIKYRKEETKQNPCRKDNVEIDKLRDAIATLAQLRQQDLSSHPAFESIDLVNTTEPDIIYLRNALNLVFRERFSMFSSHSLRSMRAKRALVEVWKSGVSRKTRLVKEYSGSKIILQPSQVPEPVTNSTTTSYTDASATNQSITGDPISSAMPSVTGVSAPFTDASKDFARFNAEKLVDAATNTDEILRNYHCSCDTENSRTMPSASVYMALVGDRILDDTTTAIEDESMTRPQLLTEWERHTDATAKDYDNLHTPTESLSIDTALSVDNDTVDRVLSALTSEELSVLATALRRSSFSLNEIGLRMDTPEEDVDTAITIPDSMALRMDTPEEGVDTAITIAD
ncbi:hypothetical protein Y032_0033g2746 [Ancylostoma ceylanicum]|nr:hypothetical protein Y032_0033g2746 [Ancylostoma ceylanicum]